MLAVGIHVFCLLNYTHYGVYTLSDFSSGAFADAMGAMSRVATDSDEGMLSVPADARQKLYDAVPALQPLAYWLEEDPQMINDFRDPELEDYRAGSFYWAIRRAAQFEGIYDSAAGAEAYWAEVASAVNAACDDGTLTRDLVWIPGRAAALPSRSARGMCCRRCGKPCAALAGR